MISSTQKTNIYSVNSLTTQIKHLLEMSYRDVWVEGEVSSTSTPVSGHTYFTLKENMSVLKCVLFKQKKYLASSLPTVGERILIRGQISMYPGRGDVQLICAYIESAGEGQLRRQFDALKSKLKAEGLFDEARKQTLPDLPKVIALITSPQGAVLHDIISTLAQRYPLVELKIYPASVQGEKAKAEIIDALSKAIKDNPDIIVLARGGGSLEDLQVFNDEQLARKVSACPVPIISAIGHETDFVITDFVADLRAPTPTAAATLMVPDINISRSSLHQYQTSLHKQMQQIINTFQQRLDNTRQGLKHPANKTIMQAGIVQQCLLRLQAAHRGITHLKHNQLLDLNARLVAQAPDHRLSNKHHELQTINARLENIMKGEITHAKFKLNLYATQFHALSPKNTLARGFAIVQDDQGRVIKTASQLKIGANIKARLYRGDFCATVNKTAP